MVLVEVGRGRGLVVVVRGRQGRNLGVRILRRPRIKDVGALVGAHVGDEQGALALVAGVGVVAKLAFPKHGEIPLLVAEVEVQTEGQGRFRVAEVDAIVGRNLAVLVGVDPLDAAQAFAPVQGTDGDAVVQFRFGGVSFLGSVELRRG